MYTIENAIDDLFLWTRRLSPSANTGRAEMLVMLRESFQRQYNAAVSADQEFFIVKYDLTPAALSFPYPPGFRSVVLIEVPDARAGYAGIYEPSEWYRKKNNSRSGFSAEAPGAMLGEDEITLSHSVEGALYYIRYYSDSVLDVESTDLETILPRAFIDGLVLDAAFLAKARFLKDLPQRAGAVRKLEEARETHSMLLQSLYPNAQAMFEAPVPATMAAKV